MPLTIAPINASLVPKTMPTGSMSIAKALDNVAVYRSGSVTIVDTADNIAMNIDALQRVNTRISSISFASGTSNHLTLSSKQITSDISTLNKISDYKLTAKDALISDVSKLVDNSKVLSIEISDSSRNISANIDALSVARVAAKVATIRQSGTPLALTVTANQLLDDKKSATLGKIEDSYTLNVSEVRLTNLSTVADNSKVKSISILDSTSEIASHLDDLLLLGVRLVKATTTDRDAMGVTATQVKNDAWVLGKIYGGYELAVKSATLKDVADLASNKKVKTVNVVDSAVNIVKNMDMLASLGTHLGSITLIDPTTPLEVKASVFSKNAGILKKITNTDVSYAVSEATYANLASLTTTGAKVATIALSDTAANIASHLDALEALSTATSGPLLTSITRTGSSNVLTVAVGQLTSGSHALASIANSFSMAVTGVSAANAKSIADLANVASIAISDSSDNIAQNWADLHALGPKLTKISQNVPAAAMNITAKQLRDMTSTLAKINGDYSLNVSNVLAADAVNTSKQKHVATISVSDTALNISANLDALNTLGTKVTAVGQTDNQTINITATQLTADNATLSKLGPNYNLAVSNVFAEDATSIAGLAHVASIAISDTSGNIAYNLNAIQDLSSKVTSIRTSGAGVPLAIQYSQLTRDTEALSKITGSYGLAVRGVTAANANTVAATAHVNSVAVSDNSADIASNLNTLKELGKQLTSITQTGIIEPMSITALQLVNNIGVLAKISNGFSLNVRNVSAANAEAVAAQRNVASITVADTSANIAAKLDTLTGLSTRITSVIQTGTAAAMNITANQWTADTAMLAKIDGGNYILAVSNVSAANVSAVAADTHVSTLAVADIADNIVGNLAALKSAMTVTENNVVKDKLGAITLVGTAPLSITATQLNNYYSNALSKIGNNYSLSVRSVLAGNAATVAGKDHVTSIAVSDSSIEIAKNLNSLTSLGKELATVTQTGITTPLKITAEQLISDKAALNKITNNYTLAVSNVKAQNAQSVAANSNVVSMAIEDTSSNIAFKLDTLQQVNSKVGSITRSDPGVVMNITGDQYILDSTVLAKINNTDDNGNNNLYNLSVSSVKASFVATVGADSHVTALSVSDTSANIANNLDALMAVNGKLGTVFQTGVPAPISLTHAQLTADEAVLAKFSNGFSLAVTNVTAANASSLASNERVVTVAVSDSSLNIRNKLDTLQGLGVKLSSITQSEPPATMAITATQYFADAGALGKISNSYTLSVSDVSASIAATLASNKRVLNLSVTDSSDNIVRNLDTLQGLGTQLTGITLTTPTNPLEITASQLADDSAALSKINNPFTLHVRGVAADFAAGVAGTTNVARVSVSDTAENISRKIDTLKTLGSKLSSVSLTSSGSPLTLTAAQWADNLLDVTNAVLPKITNGYSVVLSDMGAADAAGLANNSHVTSLSVQDSSEHIASNIDGLQNLGRKLTDIKQSGVAAPLTITATQWAADTAALAKIRDIYSLNVTGVSAGNAAKVAAQVNVATVEVTDSPDNISKNWDVLNQLSSMGNGQLSKITSTDLTANMTISATQLATDTFALSKMQDAYKLDVSAVTAGGAEAVNSMSHVAKFSILDSAENVNANIDTLDGLSKLNVISNTNATPITVTADQWAHDADTIGKINNVNYSINISGVKAADALSLITGHVASVSVADTSVAILSELSNLQAMGSALTAITQTTSTTMAITATQLGDNAATFAKFKDIYNLTVSEVNAKDALDVSNVTAVTRISISDTSANIATYLDDLQSLKIPVTDLTQTGPADPMTITADQWFNDSGILGKLDSSYSLNVTGVRLDQLAAISADSHVLTLNITDTSANIANRWSTLIALEGQLQNVTQVDVTSAMAINATQLEAADTVSLWDKFNNDYRLNVSGVAAADTTTIFERSDVSKFSVADSGTNLEGQLAALGTADNKLLHVTQNDEAAISLAASTWNPSSKIWGKFTTPLGVTLTGVSADDVLTLADQTQVSAMAVSDTRANIQNNWDDLQSVQAKLTDIAVTNSGAMYITAAQVASDDNAINKLSGTYSLAVTDATAVDAADLQNNDKVSAIAIEDSANNIANAFTSLHEMSKVTTMAANDNMSIELTMTSNQFSNTYAASLAKLSTSYSVDITDATVANASSLQGISTVNSIAINDTASNIATAIGTLNGMDTISSIYASDTTVIYLTEADQDANPVALSKISGLNIIQTA
jgi:hypothetical protein